MPPPKLTEEERIIAIEKRKQYLKDYRKKQSQTPEFKEQKKRQNRKYYEKNKDELIVKMKQYNEKSGYSKKYYTDVLKPRNEEIKEIVSLVKQMKMIA